MQAAAPCRGRLCTRGRFHRGLSVNSLADLLWAIVRWAVPLTVAAAIALVAIGLEQLDSEVRRRVEAKLAEVFPTLEVAVESAELVEGKGILVRGVTLKTAGLSSAAAPLVQVDEALLDCSISLADLAAGEVPLRGVWLRRPVIHAVLLESGEWNLAQLQPHGRESQIVPVTIEDAAIEIHQRGQAHHASRSRVSL